MNGFNDTGGAILKGTTARFDLGLTGRANTLTLGAPLSGYSNLIAVGAYVVAGLYAMAWEDIPADVEGMWIIRGEIEAIFDADYNVAGAPDAEDLFVPTATGLLELATAGDEKTLARPLDISSAVGDRNIRVIFNGIEGAGSND
jgi:hypothetical protein